MLEIALDYAAGGAAVLPLHTPTPTGCSCRRRDCGQNTGKHPRCMNGMHDATTDPAEIARWWSMWPDANIGVRPAEGVAVVDVDPRNGGDVQLAAMQDHYGALPPTRTARTGGGGAHLWWFCVGTLVGVLAPGIEIKTHSSGLLVMPPSRHRSGGVYTWADPGPIAEAPPYLRRLLTVPAPAVPRRCTVASPKVAAGLLRVVEQAQEGNRNRALYWACVRAHEHGLDVAPLVAAAVCNGLTRRAAGATARSAATAAQRSGGAA